MFGTQHLALFVFSGLLLNMTPGQDTLYIIGRSVSQGRRAGVLSALGIASGSVIHTLAAAFGLSAALATSAQTFVAIKLAGAAYLMFLGVRMLLERTSDGGSVREFSVESDGAVFRAGLLTNILNPKVAVFFLAFLPQFVEPTAGHRVGSFLFLGGLFIVGGTLWSLVLVWSSTAMSHRMKHAGNSALVLKRVTGTIFVALGLRLAVSR